MKTEKKEKINEENRVFKVEKMKEEKSAFEVFCLRATKDDEN